ncbi:MAG TPA: allantoate amidohydrolase [Gaiellaceae bacterium]
MTLATFDGLWESLAGIGREAAGYRRLPWTPAELEARDWFRTVADERGLSVEQDRNGNLWAWWGDEGEAVVTGSHLDSVVDGGAYDGALGVVCAFAAVDQLRAEKPRKRIGVVAFNEEEGARFGRPCLGSKLMCGQLEPFDELSEFLESPGPDPERVAKIDAFVEVHVEQGRFLEVPLGVASEIWPHGRFRFDFTGESNHAGTTPMADRQDAMLDFARATLAVRDAAVAHGGLGTFGRVQVEPNSTNSIASLVRAWLDARGPDDATVDAIVAAVDGEPVRESWTPAVLFDVALRDRIASLLDAPLMTTAAGHDAAILATAGVPASMIFVRNHGGVSHAIEEHADREDCLAAVDALARVLKDLAC